MDQIILIVDDDVTSLKMATGILEKDYRVASAISGAMAFKYLENNTPDLILLDINMPDMDGFEVMEQLSANPDYQKIPVIFLTATQAPQTESKCLEAGAIDFVSKPFIPQVLKSRVRRVVELYDYKEHLESMIEEQSKEILERTNQISDIQNAVIVGMANLIEERDNNTGRHVKNTQTYVEMICSEMKHCGLYSNILTDEYISDIIKAAPLHDIGKIKISDAILQKTGVLSDEEYKIMCNHTRLGADIIEEILGGIEDEDYLRIARDVVLYHHERWDGNGYPEGLRGEDIPLAGRIMAIADSYDTLCEECIRKDGDYDKDKVFAIMKESSETQFDPTIIEVFMTLKDRV